MIVYYLFLIYCRTLVILFQATVESWTDLTVNFSWPCLSMCITSLCSLQDFGDTIPGHGGIMDRFDCQFLMAMFEHVYHFSLFFCRTSVILFQATVESWTDLTASFSWPCLYMCITSALSSKTLIQFTKQV